MARATRADVARAAGVSVATVSHVMNGRAEELGFSPQTAERVRQAAAKVGYVPRAAARSFRYQSSKVIALFFPDLPTSLRLPVFNEVLTGCLEAARQAGYFILPVPISTDPRAQVEQTLKEVEIAGAVGRAAESMRPAARLLAQAEVPTAWIATGHDCPTNLGDVLLSIDEDSGVHEMLAAIDCDTVRHPAVVIGPGDPGRRLATYLEVFPQADVVVSPGWTHRDGLEAAPRVLDSGADLVFAASDQLATAVVETMLTRSLAPGKDVQVFGFGDIEGGPAAATGLSSVRWPVADLGLHATRVALEMVRTPRDERRPVTNVLATSARPRRTTRPARTSETPRGTVAAHSA